MPRHASSVRARSSKGSFRDLHPGKYLSFCEGRLSSFDYSIWPRITKSGQQRQRIVGIVIVGGAIRVHITEIVVIVVIGRAQPPVD